MTELRKIYKRDIPSLLKDSEFWKHSFLSISKHRLISHYNNPELLEDDIVLVLAYLDNELVGYMGVFIDLININETQQKIGWLSTWWVHPKTKGTGIGKSILDQMYIENNGFIGISQFTPSAKRVYDKSGYFNDLKIGLGFRYAIRSNVASILSTKYPKINKVKIIPKITDSILNIVSTFKIKRFKNKFFKENKNIKLEYLRALDIETFDFIHKTNNKDISIKNKEFYEWLLGYYWVLKAPIIELTEKNKFAFSMNDNEFDISLIKIIRNEKVVGVLVIQKRNFVSKVLFTYYLQESVKLIADVILMQNIYQNTKSIVCYDAEINSEIDKASVFLYKAKLEKHSIISKKFNKTDFDSFKMHFGDGDCCFA